MIIFERHYIVSAMGIRTDSPYMEKIRITGLYGISAVEWDLHRGVNILSGINGSGKSTVLENISNLFHPGTFRFNPNKPVERIEIRFENGEVLSSDRTTDREYNVDIVSTFDSTLKVLEAVQKLSGNKVRSDLDWELYRLQQRYLSYQLSLGKEAINILLEKGPQQELSKLMERRNRFYDLVDSLFAETGKKIVRESDELLFRTSRLELSPYQLSSGEKQMLVILTTVLTQNGLPYIMLMDEPEISLHFDWQKQLIHHIMSLNPNLQLLLATHSPAVIMDGWLDKVTDIGDIILPES